MNVSHPQHITSKDINKSVTLKGWVNRRRDHGGVIFVDLRSSNRIIQIVFNPEESELFKIAESLRSEYVIEVTGIIKQRSEETINKDLSTGQFELVANELILINKSKTPPFSIGDLSVNEDQRLKYRYIDMRGGNLQENLQLRSKLLETIRNFFYSEGFIDIETPILTKTTPEGARDYLVPSRVHPGHFFALPQSPQIFKQTLMIGGIEKYFQIARCFRDEDLRADRQPEFTQLDIEMSFIEEEEIIDFNERLIKKIWKDILNIDLINNFPRMTWKEAMDNYGTDRPDTRYEMLLKNVSSIMGDIGFNIFTKTIDSGGEIKCITVKEGNSSISNVRIKPGGDIFKVAQEAGAGGLAFIRVKENDIDTIGAIKNGLNKSKINQLLELTGAESGDLILFGAGPTTIVNQSLDKVRQYLAKELDILKTNNNKWNFLWITDFPMFERNDDENRLEALHHPFCAPKEIKLNNQNESSQKLESSIAQAYDLVLNGLELGGGSIRIHQSELQKEVLETVGLSEAEINDKFGFLIEALEMGAPPHGGIAFGLDRIVMLMIGADSIRETIAFPKNQQSKCLLTKAPSIVSKAQLKELEIEITVEE